MTKPDPTQRAIKALEQALKSLNCDDWGELDMNGEGAMKPAAHDIVQFPQGCPVCQLRDAITLLRSQPAPPQRVDVEAVGTLRRDDNGDILFTPTTEFRVIDGMPVFIASPPKEVGSYAMSRDYEALWALLQQGGSTLGLIRERYSQRKAIDLDCRHNEYLNALVHYGQEAFLSECQRLNLEWLAPSKVTVEQVMEVFKQWAFDNWEHFKDVEGLRSWTRSGPRDNSNMGRDLSSRLTSLFASH